MTDEQENTSLRKQNNTQNIDEKSKILKIAFANHNRHISFGAIKEIINSKPDAKNFETFKAVDVSSSKIGLLEWTVWIFKFAFTAAASVRAESTPPDNEI